MTSASSSSHRTRVDCAHWRACGVIGGGCCAHPEQPHGEHPSRGVCGKVCERREQSETAAEQTQAEGALQQYAQAAKRAAHSAHSVAKTSLGIDRATDEQVEARLNVCRNCPGGHAVWKDGDVRTCGPMLASIKDEGGGTCGCVLRKKARDRAERCPFNWWPVL